uniref:Ell-associated factor Eaf n=1 Tax=Strongyloides venezuelensis TaxID=75913 RepID=A0A0K0FI51_STRVS
MEFLSSDEDSSDNLDLKLMHISLKQRYKNIFRYTSDDIVLRNSIAVTTQRNDYEVKELYATEDKNFIIILKDREHTLDVNLQDVDNSCLSQKITELPQDRATYSKISKESPNENKHGTKEIKADSVPRVTMKNLLDHLSFVKFEFKRTRKSD